MSRQGYVFLMLLTMIAPVSQSFAGPVGADAPKREVMPLRQILDRAQALHPGRVIESDLNQHHGAVYVYEIEILDSQGRVWEMYFDPYDGKLVRTLSSEE